MNFIQKLFTFNKKQLFFFVINSLFVFLHIFLKLFDLNKNFEFLVKLIERLILNQSFDEFSVFHILISMEKRIQKIDEYFNNFTNKSKLNFI